MSVIIYIAVMALVTYLVRMLPFTLFRKQIKSPFIKSVLYYLPYAVLAAMTFPAIFYSTGNMLAAAVSTLLSLVLAYLDLPLIIVAVAAAASAFGLSFIM